MVKYKHKLAINDPINYPNITQSIVLNLIIPVNHVPNDRSGFNCAPVIFIVTNVIRPTTNAYTNAYSKIYELF